MEASGGKESARGWIKLSNGGTRLGKNVGLVRVVVLLTSSISASPLGFSVSRIHQFPTSDRMVKQLPSSRSSSPSTSSSPWGSESGNIAHIPVMISRASCTVRSTFSKRSSSRSESDLWSDFGRFFIGGSFIGGSLAFVSE